MEYDEPDTALHADNTGSKGPIWFMSQRYILGYLLSSGLMVLFFLRFNFGIALVCMVNQTAIEIQQMENDPLDHHYYQHNHIITYDGALSYNMSFNNKSLDHNDSFTTSTVKTRPRNKAARETHERAKGSNPEMAGDGERKESQQTSGAKNVVEEMGRLDSNSSSGGCVLLIKSISDREDGPFVWDKQMQGILLGAVFWVYVLVLPANHILRKMSRKKLSAITVAVNSFLSALLHGAAMWGPWAMFAVRITLGICSSVSLAALYGMWTDWAPPKERAGLISICFAGIMVSNAVVFPVSAMLCKYGFLGGWPSIFYVFGMVGLVWTLLFWVLTSDSPATHPRISDQERSYIEASLSDRPNVDPHNVPWVALLTSPAVWALNCYQMSNAWGLFLFLSTLPLYMKEVLKFDIRANGFYSTFPFVAMLICNLTSGQIADVLYRRNILRVLWIRKLYASLSSVVPAIFLCVVGYLDCSRWQLAVGCLTVAVGFSAIALVVYPVNAYEIAPLYAQFIYAMGNAAASVCGIIAPYTATAMTKNGTRAEWQVVMFLTAGIYILGTIVYFILGSVDVQEWAKPKLARPPLLDKEDNEV